MRRRFRRRPPAVVLALAALAAVVLCRASWDWQAAGPDRRTVIFAPGPCTITRVISGESLWIRQPPTKPNDRQPPAIEGEIRLLGVRAPARSADGSEAMAVAMRHFMEDFVRGGSARLELDKRRLSPDGCFLAYVIVDGRLLNVELVRQGWARADSMPGDSATVARLLRRAEDEARLAGRGMWHETDSGDSRQNGADDPG